MNDTAPFHPQARNSVAGAAGSSIGVLLHSPRLYDMFLELALLGRAPRFREQLLGLAELRPGETILDVGCGTGSLAMLARKAVGPAGIACGVDASPEMIAWARRKAERAGVEVSLQRASAQALPFPDAHFDAVLSTLMLHHLSGKARTQLVHEARRVLKPGGRVLIVDFAAASPRKGLMRHLRHRHGNVPLAQILTLLEGAGLAIAASGPVGIKNVHYALARVPAAS